MARFKLLGRVITYLAVLAMIAGAVWWVVSPRIDLQAHRAESAEQRLAEAERLIRLQADALKAMQEQQDRIALLDRQLHLLHQTINNNARQHSRALEELKRNDQTIADYLALPVPADLGVLYARPDTTDPAAYRPPSALQPDPLPPTRPPPSAGN